MISARAHPEFIVQYELNPNMDQPQWQQQEKQQPLHQQEEPDQLDQLHIFNDYHLDIWHHLSKHIAPEDISRFALICRKTAYVTSTGEFWKNMYRRHTAKDKLSLLPDRLQPHNVLKQPKGLRANVIRTLFITHQPFIDRMEQLRKKEQLSTDPERNIDNLHSHPVYQQIQKCKYNGKCFTKTLEMPNKSKLWKKSYNFLPKCYFNIFNDCSAKWGRRTKAKHLLKFAHLHQSEEIYYNEDDGCVILFVKALKEARMKQVQRRFDGDDEINHLYVSLVKSLTMLAEINVRTPVPSTEIRLVFQEPQQRNAIAFLQTTMYGLYNWWDPMYDKVFENDF